MSETSNSAAGVNFPGQVSVEFLTTDDGLALRSSESGFVLPEGSVTRANAIYSKKHSVLVAENIL